MALVPVLLVAASIILARLPTAQAAEQVKVEAMLGQGYARIILNFPKLPKYQANVSNGVMIFSFDKEIAANIQDIPQKLKDYVVVGRIDPDGKAFRFALAQPIRINTIEAGDRLFIDLLPKNWVGLPPPLPPEVIAELARRAKAAEKASRQEMRLKALKNSKFKMKLRFAQFPTFSRLQFEWNAFVEASLSRKGDAVTVLFDELANANIGRLKADPPNFLKSAEKALTDDGLKFTLMVTRGADIRGFRDGNAYIVDIAGSTDALPAQKAARRLIGQAEDAGSVKSGALQVKGEGAPDLPSVKEEKAAPLAGTPENLKLPQNTVGTKDASKNNKRVKKPIRLRPNKSPVVAVTQTQPLDHNGVTDGAAGIDAGPRAGQADAAIQDQLAGAVDRAKRDPKLAQPAMKPAKNGPRFKKSSRADAKNPTSAGPLKVKASEAGTSLRLVFPFENQVPAAVFVRADAMWMVFDTPRSMDLSNLRSLDPKHVLSTTQTNGQTHQVLRFKLSQPYLTTVDHSDNTWRVTIGDLIAEPGKTVALKRGLRTDGRAKVTIKIPGARNVHWIEDKEIGDKLAVVTAVDPVHRMPKLQKFVDFWGLATAQGLALQPHADNLDVRLINDELLVTRREGLTLSSSGTYKRDPKERAVADQTRPGHIDFASWAGDPRQFTQRVQQFEEILASMTDKQSVGPRFELARIYMGNRLNAEALGVMKRITEIDTQISKDPVFNAMRGVANLLMFRLKDARKDLTVAGLKEDLDAALWRGLLQAREGRWREAQLSFLKGDLSIKHYPDDIKALFRLAAARAAISTNDMTAARFYLDTLPKRDLANRFTAEALVLRGRMLQALGRHNQALEVFDEAIARHDRRMEGEARFFKTDLAFRLGKLDLEKAVGELHAVSLSWRGDELELKVLRKLAQLQIDQKAYRDSLKTMKTALTAYPRHQISRGIQDNMSTVFEDLFLNGKADDMPPVRALSLYYDYRELTPVGRRGDQMIRRLADRLISVDLLDQAAEILSHQVENRLLGAARAQVAAKLAMVYLLNLKPRLALQALRKSRVAVLPKALLRERLLLEARALSELGRAQPAVDLLANETGEDAALLRAEALWSGRKWQMAGETFEKLLGDSWKLPTALSPDQRLHVLRGAIAYSFAEDKLGLERFRAKFVSKMADGPDAKSFALVTQPASTESLEFRNLAREIAAIDTLESFLSDFRKRFKDRNLPNSNQS